MLGISATRAAHGIEHQAMNLLGLDSIMIAELQGRIRADIGVHMPLSSFIRTSRIADLADEISARLGKAAPPPPALMTGGDAVSPWVLLPEPRTEASVRLFCLPYAGGGVSVFRGWADKLPSWIEAVSIRLPGRDGRLDEVPHVSMPSLVAALADGLRPYLDKPFALFGHSLGGLVSFELARHLRDQGMPAPARLFLSAVGAPCSSTRRIAVPRHALPDAEFLEEIRRFHGTPAEVLRNEELRRLFLPVLRADFALAETYTHAVQPALEIPVSVFGGTEDAIVCREELDAWRAHFQGPFSLNMLAGDHFFIQRARKELLRHITRDLRELATNGEEHAGALPVGLLSRPERAAPHVLRSWQ